MAREFLTKAFMALIASCTVLTSPGPAAVTPLIATEDIKTEHRDGQRGRPEPVRGAIRRILDRDVEKIFKNQGQFAA
ncbi:hypothetical protein F4680DRAFT_33244 [Xylaria scruposa]|nr:hypothetical protein F4680DRAFT_33244 [Xylaria scruposa]